jgi:hypothetical protein
MPDGCGAGHYEVLSGWDHPVCCFALLMARALGERNARGRGLDDSGGFEETAVHRGSRIARYASCTTISSVPIAWAPPLNPAARRSRQLRRRPFPRPVLIGGTTGLLGRDREMGIARPISRLSFTAALILLWRDWAEDAQSHMSAKRGQVGA